MIEKFNFYDVYGYFLPGLALLILFWAPFGLVPHFWPPTELSSALAALGFAYILGHLLQTLAVNAIPSGVWTGARYRFHSERLLDPSDPTFSSVFKGELAARVKRALNIDLEVSAEADKEISSRRQDAFFLSRAILLREKVVSYAEQFEGMYALMRGLTLAFFLAFVYLAGWGASLFKREWLPPMAVGVALAALALTVVMGAAVARSDQRVYYWLSRRTEPVIMGAAVAGSERRAPGLDRASVGALSIALFAAGYRLGFERLGSPGHCVSLCLLSIAALFACIRFFAAYHNFAKEFAKTVWRDFAAYQIGQSRAKQHSSTSAC